MSMALLLDGILDERSIHTWCVHYRSTLAHTDAFRSYRVLIVGSAQCHLNSSRTAIDMFVEGGASPTFRHYLQERPEDVRISRPNTINHSPHQTSISMSVTPAICCLLY